MSRPALAAIALAAFAASYAASYAAFALVIRVASHMVDAPVSPRPVRPFAGARVFSPPLRVR